MSSVFFLFIMRNSLILFLMALQCHFCHLLAADNASYHETLVKSADGDYAYKLMRPNATGGKYPLVVFLHGAGERGTDNVAQLKFLPTMLAQPAMRERYPCFVLAPQCAPHHQWVDAPWGDKISQPMAAAPSVMLAHAIAALEAVRLDPQVDAQRIYLTGISMGGYGTWELALRHPDWFAAVVPICGGGDEAKAATLKTLPLWAFHGTADTVVWPERSQRMVDAIKAAGGTPKLTLLQAVGHNSWEPAYDEKSGLLAWLFQQKRSINK
jgi:predicted peptidase